MLVYVVTVTTVIARRPWSTVHKGKWPNTTLELNLLVAVAHTIAFDQAECDKDVP